MDEKRRPVHSVDDYYPKPSSYSCDSSADDDAESGASLQDTKVSGSYDTDTPDSSHPDASDNSSGREDTSQQWQSSRSLRCPHCGNEVPGDMNFCSLCGYHFPKDADTPYPLNNTRIDGYLVDDIAAFVAVNYAPYLQKFQKLVDGKISFNWAAAIFSNRWMAYRGMFRTAFLFSIILNTVSGVLSYIILMMFQSFGTEISAATSDQIYMFSLALTVGVGLISGLIGDSLYWKHTKKHLDRFQCQNREAVSNTKIARSLRMSGGCRIGYAMLIIVFDLTFNEMVTSVLQYIISR